jgi:hypothetical protein
MAPGETAHVPFEAAAVEQSVCARFEQQARRHPDRVAVAAATAGARTRWRASSAGAWAMATSRWRS